MMLVLGNPQFTDSKSNSIFNTYTFNPSLEGRVEIINSDDDFKTVILEIKSIDGKLLETKELTVKPSEPLNITLNELESLKDNASGLIKIFSDSANVQGNISYYQKSQDAEPVFVFTSAFQSDGQQDLNSQNVSQQTMPGAVAPRSAGSNMINRNTDTYTGNSRISAVATTFPTVEPTYTTVPTTTVSGSPSPTPSETHKECKTYNSNGFESYKCESVNGKGADLCSGDTGCSFTFCDSFTNRCRSQGGPGVNSCTSSPDSCRQGTRCGTSYGFTTCLSNPNSPYRECTDRADCLSYTFCQTDGTCGTNSGAGSTGVKCNDVADCGKASKHNECNTTSKTCVAVDGLGPDQCSSHGDCQGLPPKHTECTSKLNGSSLVYQCSLVNGAGENQCQTDGECMPPSYGSHCIDNQGFPKCMQSSYGGPRDCESDAACIPAAKGTKCEVALDRVSKRCMQDDTSTVRACGSDYDCNFPSPTPSGTPSSSPKVVATTTMEMSGFRGMLGTSASKYSWKGSEIGSDTAKVSIEIFQDTNCGMCKYAYNNLLPGLLEEYVSTGKAKLKVKEFPLIPDSSNLKEAYAINCAAEQNKYGS